MLASPALRTPRTCPSSTPAESPLSFTPSPRMCTRIYIHTHTHTLYIPVLFSFPFLFLSLGHASTPFSHPRFSFEFCGKRVSLSSFLPPFLPVFPTVFSLSLLLGNSRPLSLSLSPSLFFCLYPTLLEVVYRCCVSFSIGCTTSY